jgi:imidazolonepropionase-like amidohydrolase
MQRILVPLLGLLPCLAQIPAPPQQRPIALVNARLYTVSHGVIENGTLLFANGRILAVGRDVPVPDTAVRIDCAGKRVYPGFITAASRLGLVEIDAVRATRDYAEVGEFNPNITAATAFNVESEIIPTVRSNGILLAHVMPEGGLISGRSSIMLLDGWTAPEATLKAVASVVVRMPERPWWEERRSAEQRYRQQLQRLYDFLEQARQYSYAVRHGAARPTRDLRLEAMRVVF